MSINYFKSQAGLTIIEVTVSMFLIFVLFLLYLAAANTTFLARKNNYENIAYHIANKQMETLRETAFADLANTTANIVDPQLSQIPSGAGTYTIGTYNPMSGLKIITVTVTWNDGQSKNFTLTTLAGNGGINP